MEFNSELDEYVKNHIDSESDVLKELDRYTQSKVLYPRMISGHIQGRILSFISKMILPKYILEIGTYTGYSAICLAEGLAVGGELHTIEINDELQDVFNSFFKKAGVENKIKSFIGDSKNIIPTLDYTYDLVFIDGDKREYPEYYKLIFDKLKSGGYIIADNILWSGKVVEPVKSGDLQTKGILEFNRIVKEDQRVSQIILPFRDGISLIRKG